MKITFYNFFSGITVSHSNSCIRQEDTLMLQIDIHTKKALACKYNLLIILHTLHTFLCVLLQENVQA